MEGNRGWPPASCEFSARFPADDAERLMNPGGVSPVRSGAHYGISHMPPPRNHGAAVSRNRRRRQDSQITLSGPHRHPLSHHLCRTHVHPDTFGLEPADAAGGECGKRRGSRTKGLWRSCLVTGSGDALPCRGRTPTGRVVKKSLQPGRTPCCKAEDGFRDALIPALPRACRSGPLA